jgi:hypothetical protein
MTGCFYVPWFTRQTDHSQTDFRALIGPENSSKPLRIGHVTRDQIIARLGPPDAVSDGDIAIAYRFDTLTGFWIYPLCFTAFQGSEHGYAVRFQFDSNGTLVRYDTADRGKFDSFFDDNSAGDTGQTAINELKQYKPQLHYVPAGDRFAVPTSAPTTGRSP